MSITITSTTDSNEAVTAAMGSLATKEGVTETQTPAQAETTQTGETQEASGASESEEDEGSENPGEEGQEAGKEGEPEPKEGDKPKKVKGFKKRIDKLTQRLTEKNREVEYWKQEAIKSRPATQETKPQANPEAAAPSDGKPKESDFETHDQFIEALTDWKLDQREKAREENARKAEAQTSFQKQVQAHVERVEAFKKAHDDFEETIDGAPVSVPVQRLILESENGPELMYELAKNRAELDRINQLPAMAAARELGKFEAKIKAQTESKTVTKTKSNAPQPISTVSGRTGNGVKKSIYDQSLSQREYEKLRQEQRRSA